jgi:hypothetical protein
MGKNNVASPLKALLRFLRAIFISILGGAVMGILAAVVGSFFNIER